MRYYENYTTFTLKNYILLCLNVNFILYGVFVRLTQGSAGIAIAMGCVFSLLYIMFFTKGAIDEICYKKAAKRSKFRSETRKDI